jgi:hypothetical protein
MRAGLTNGIVRIMTFSRPQIQRAFQTVGPQIRRGFPTTEPQVGEPAPLQNRDLRTC